MSPTAYMGEREDVRAGTLQGATGRAAASTAARACSFTGATNVLMADGTRKAIKDVKVGDTVVATDPETGEQTGKPVEQVFAHLDDVVRLTVNGEQIETTEDHPFWSHTNQRFERADRLSVGEQLLTASGQTATVSNIDVGPRNPTPAYNLGVRDLHTFHVGQQGLLVHNTCGVPNSASSSEVRRVGDLLESIDDVYANPRGLLAGKSPAEVQAVLKGTPGWRVERLGKGSRAGQGWVYRQYTATGETTGRQLRWHPGGGHHGPAPYWRVVGPNGDIGGVIR